MPMLGSKPGGLGGLAHSRKSPGLLYLFVFLVFFHAGCRAAEAASCWPVQSSRLPSFLISSFCGLIALRGTGD